MALVKLSTNSIEKIDYVVDSRMNIDQVFAKYKPDYILNGCMYDMSSGATITNSIDEGKRHGVYFSRKGIGIVGGNKLVATTIDQALVNDSISDFIGGAPLLVWNSKVDIDDTGLKDYYMNATRLRSVFGMDGSNVYFYVPDSAKGFNTLAKECVNLGMTCAINLDGGGSTIMGKKVNGKLAYIGPHTEKRKNANWILIYLKKPKTEVSSVRTIKCQDVTVEVSENNNKRTFDGVVIDGVTYAPVRKVFEGQGANVSYDAAKKKVFVNK